jgi:hypothetical protein
MEALGYIPDEEVLEEIKAKNTSNLFTRIINFFQHRVNRQNLPLKVEQARFLDETKLDQTRPNHNISFPEPGCYEMVREHIAVHKYLKAVEFNTELSYEQAAVSWYDTVYLPIVKLVRDRDVYKYFPGNTEGDLYIWLVSRRAALENENRLMGDVSNEQLVEELQKEGESTTWAEWLHLFRQKLDIQSLLPH